MDKQETKELRSTLENLPYETPLDYHGIIIIHRNYGDSTAWIMEWKQRKPRQRRRFRPTIDGVIDAIQQMIRNSQN